MFDMKEVMSVIRSSWLPKATFWCGDNPHAIFAILKDVQYFDE